MAHQENVLLPIPSAAEVIVDPLLLSGMSEMLEDPLLEPQEIELFTIHRVPEKTRKADPGAYDPQIISIGPYHNGTTRLLPMERVKWQFLRDLIRRHSSNTLHNYIKAVTCISSKAIKCYSDQEVVGGIDHNSFVRNMVLDGCFIVEFLCKLSLGERLGELGFTNWKIPLVESDLLLVENQIPFFVVECLFDFSIVPSLQSTSTSITLKEIAWRVTLRNGYNGQPVPSVTHHLLHLYHSSLQPVSQDVGTISRVTSIFIMCRTAVRPMINTIKNFFPLPMYLLGETVHPTWGASPLRRIPSTIPTATELDKVGVKFIVDQGGCLLNITFKGNGFMVTPQLMIPHLTLDELTISKFRNQIVFEQWCPSSGNHFTSYAAFMHNLIRTTEDVALLERNGILLSNLGGNKEVVAIFDDLGKGAYLDYESHYLSGLFKDVTDYHVLWSLWLKERIKHNFPELAILAFGLALLQAVLAVHTYRRSRVEGKDKA